MKHLNTKEDIKEIDAFNTGKEIFQQPSTWLKTFDVIQSNKSKIKDFLNELGRRGSFDIIFMGAGTSEYIGNTLVNYFNKNYEFKARSVATTDMILSPELYINPKRKTLFISYGRSGNSPESVGAVQAVNAYTEQAYHLFITCNKNGALAKLAYMDDRVLAIELPDETNDLGFAMTSSFTNMITATLLCFNINELDKYETYLNECAHSVQSNLTKNASKIKSLINEYNFERIVYLGSQNMKAFAQESALKILELTQGKVATLYDTLTGFRHGPKSFINAHTLIVIYLSDHELTRKYELDLINELKSQQKGYKILTISNAPYDANVDYAIQYDYTDIPSEFIGLKMIVIAQLIGFFKSLSLGITVDNPCPTGEVNRVVTGVTIYPVKPIL